MKLEIIFFGIVIGGAIIVLIFAFSSFHLLPNLKQTGDWKVKVNGHIKFHRYNNNNATFSAAPVIHGGQHEPEHEHHEEHAKHPSHDENQQNQHCPQHSIHFDITPPVLTPKMKKELNFKTEKINKNKRRRKFGPDSNLRKMIDACLNLEFDKGGTPECAMWNCFPMKEEEDEAEQQQEADKNDVKENENHHKNKQQNSHRQEVSLSSFPSTSLRKCCFEHKALRDTAHWVIDKLEEHNIRYFLSTGTALGAIRHKGTIIPWDTDVDIAIFPDDAERAKTVFTELSHLHFFHEDPNGKKMFWVHHSKNGKPVDGPHVEIFFEHAYTDHPDELLPLERCDFYGHQNAWCPKRDMFEKIWFPGGWKNYGGDHYHDDGRCTEYYLGKKIEKKKCK